MGHASSTYLLQVSEFNGTYKNPFKSGGRGIKYTKWRTVGGMASGAAMHEVKKMWLDAFASIDPAKIMRYRVRYKGQTIISHQGRVYKQYTPEIGKPWMTFVETLPGCEELI
jgi:hypothetical protein